MYITGRISPCKNSEKYQHLLSIPQKIVGMSKTSISCCWCWWNSKFFAFNLVIDGWMLWGQGFMFHGFGMMDGAGMGLVYQGFELGKELYVYSTVWCVLTACVLGEGVEMSSWLDGHSFILLFVVIT